jgi:hypothetical protein
VARYFLRFRHSDTGLTPVFTGGTFFKKASDLTPVTPPPIAEVGNGTYYFDYSPTFDIVFEVDGGASIPTEEVRYIADTISPKDSFVDEPTSQVKDDVLNAALSGHQTAGSVGRFINDIFRLLKNKAHINASTKQLEIYDDAGSSIVFTMDLKDENGVASATRIFRRLPL